MIDFSTLQAGQYRHDRDYHDDIVDRGWFSMEHYQKHLAKYAGRLASQEEQPHADPTITLIDTCLILLAGANELKLDLAAKVPAIPVLQRPFLRQLTISNGAVAEALEKRDHIEAFDYKGAMDKAWLTLTASLLAEHRQLGIDTMAVVPTRWRAVEAKSPLRQLFAAGRS